MTPAWKCLLGDWTYIDQCVLGLELEDEDGVIRPVKKPTCLFTTKKKIQTLMEDYVCDGNHEHCNLTGHIRGHGPRSQLAENYPPEMAEQLAIGLTWHPFFSEAEAMVAAEEEEREQEEEFLEERGRIPPRDPDQVEQVKANRELKSQVGVRAFDYVARLQKNLGHPSSEVLVKMLQEVQATENVITAAKKYLCPNHYNRKRPAQVPPSSGISSTVFNNRLMADSAWIQLDDDENGEKKRACVLTLVDEATRFLALRILKSEKSSEFIKGAERCWIRHFGCPKIIRVDSAKGWSAAAIRDWCSEKGIVLEVAPAEAHNWLGVVERRHQVVRRSLEFYMEEVGKKDMDSLKEAAIYVRNRINNLSFTKGFSPYQWVVGKTPQQEMSLIADHFSPGVDIADDATHFALQQAKRVRAGAAFLKADADLKLRVAGARFARPNHIYKNLPCLYYPLLTHPRTPHFPSPLSTLSKAPLQTPLEAPHLKGGLKGGNLGRA